MKYGFVYVLSNDSMPGIFKIGFTLKHPRERMEELSRATACPTPFDLAGYIGCEDPQHAEQSIHRDLASYRVNHAREFFKCHPTRIIDQLEQWADGYDDALVLGELKFLAWQQDKTDNGSWLHSLFLEQTADPVEWPTHRGFE
jgi:hypothetical protein